jgi:hypothetical protein
MYVRLAFAVAAHPSTRSGQRLEPETCPERSRRILLVDEVLAVGDAAQERSVVI